MKIEFDPAKNEENQAKHNLRFEDVHELDWDNAIYKPDGRKDYGETRYRAFVYGPDKKPYSVAFTVRGENVRLISFRRAHERERKTL